MDLIVLEDDNHRNENGETTAMKVENLYVAVGKEVKESESLIMWAIQNSGGCRISIIHVHQPDEFIPILGKKYHWRSLEEHQVSAYRRIERQLMLKTLDEYLDICHQFGVEGEKLYTIEMDSIEKGILQLISEHNIEKLVMGAAADGNYHTKMMEPKSKKAVYLQLHAPAFCHIWFICKGHLIHQRDGSSPLIVYAENETSTNLRSVSLIGQSNNSQVFNGNLPFHEGDPVCRVDSRRVTEIPSMDSTESTPISQTQLDIEAGCYDWSEIMRWSRQQESDVPGISSSHVIRESTTDLSGLCAAGPFSEQIHHLRSPPNTLQEDAAIDKQSEALERAILKVKATESLYVEEVRKKNDLIEELASVKTDRDKLREELQVAMAQNSVLESKVANYDLVVKDLEEGIISNVELLQIYEKERDDLKIERDNVLKTAEELVNQSAEAAYEANVPRLFNSLSFSEIKEATNDFDPSVQLWEGENGSIYKGVIAHSPVTVRMWHPEGLQGPQEFHQEVEILSRFRHPNLVTLMGVCPEAWALVYEYVPNGSLEDRISCKDNTPPLSWQSRIRITAELCCALIFLHSRMPQRVVHGSLKPASVLLDSNFSCKLMDFRFSRMIPYHEDSLSTDLSYSSEYMDPEFIMTGEVNPAVDVYSFGMIVLELLTGKPAFGIRAELEDALDEQTFDSLLDALAGDWPFVQAEQLARLALRCCEDSTSNRPDLETEVWRVLEPMRASCGRSPSLNYGDEEHRQVPSYFLCPIFQEVMKDPHVAADGYTYEAEALRGWLDGGHDTSPMTNLQLEHLNLVPNHALRSAIQEWQQQH